MTRDPRKHFGLWAGRYFVSVCVGGYGISIGSKVIPFRNYAYRGWRRA